MAALARRTWAELATETQRRLGGINYTGFDTRIHYWLRASHWDLCTKYYHPELFTVNTSLTLSTSTNTLALPAGTFIVIAMLLRTGSTYVGELARASFSALIGAYKAEIGLPKKRARGGNTLYFDKKPDQAYASDFFYYKVPAAPDFAGSGSPETAEDMDEHIVEGALRIADPAIGRPDHGDVDRQLLVEWLTDQVRPRLVDEPLEMQSRVETERAMGGAQG